MPKIVDHDARKAELVAAVWRVISRSGMNSATVRSVAAEAGVSPSSLRHYFSDQSELLIFAAQAMTSRIVARLESHPDEGGGLERAQRVLEEMLPLDDDRSVEVSVWLEALTRARFDDRLATLKTAGWFGERYLCRVAWAHLKGIDLPRSAEGVFGAEIDERSAAQLHAFIDGLTLQAITYPEHLCSEAVVELLHGYLTERWSPDV